METYLRVIFKNNNNSSSPKGKEIFDRFEEGFKAKSKERQGNLLNEIWWSKLKDYEYLLWLPDTPDNIL